MKEKERRRFEIDGTLVLAKSTGMMRAADVIAAPCTCLQRQLAATAAAKVAGGVAEPPGGMAWKEIGHFGSF